MTAGGSSAQTAVSEKKEKKPNVFIRIKNSGFFGAGTKAMCAIFALSLAAYIIARIWPAFAEFWTRHPAQGIRFVLAKLTGWIPFSLAEAALLCLPLAVVCYLVASAVSTKRDGSTKNFNRWLRPVVCIILAVASIFLAGFGPAYGRYTLAENLGLESAPVSGEELYKTAVALMKEMKPLIDEVDFDPDGASVMPYDYDGLVAHVNDAYEKYAAGAEFVSHYYSYPKPIALSEPMTYTHIAGVYTFMTGESNVNINYPDFLNAFTMAHEMSHQRGIAREDEANFMAFLVCVSADDVYVRYCGYANLLNYVMSALSSADKDLYSQFRRENLDPRALGEYVAYSRFFDKYRESTASKVTGAVNDGYLKIQGQKAGSKSYGLVVDLAVAYYKNACSK